MKHLISSIQSSSYIPYNEVYPTPAGAIPIKSVFNSAQSHGIVNAGYHNSANWTPAGAIPIKSVFNSAQSHGIVNADYHNSANWTPVVTTPIKSVFNSAQSHDIVNADYLNSANWWEFSGACTCSLEDVPVPEVAGFEAQYVALAQEPLETLNNGPVLLDMGKSTGTPLSPSCVGPILNEHFEKWYECNIRWDRDLASGKSAPPEMELHTVLAMISGDYPGAECAHQSFIPDRVQSFASVCNIDPLVWSVMVMFNGKPMTFLPRDKHHVVAKSMKSKGNNPITNLDVQAWQGYVKDAKGKIDGAIQSSFAMKRKINKFTFKKIVSLHGWQNPDKKKNKRLIYPQIFIKPEWLGISNKNSERITAEHLKSWNETRNIEDYGIEDYLYLANTRLSYPRDTVRSWRQYEKETETLIMSDFARRHALSLKGVITLAERVKNWDRLPALTQLDYAMSKFSSSYSLDPFAWRFLAWSNELTILKSRVSDGEKVLQTLQTLQVESMEQMEQIQKMTQIQQMEQVEQMAKMLQIEDRLRAMREELKVKTKDAMQVG